MIYYFIQRDCNYCLKDKSYPSKGAAQVGLTHELYKRATQEELISNPLPRSTFREFASANWVGAMREFEL